MSAKINCVFFNYANVYLLFFHMFQILYNQESCEKQKI
jgi:hypothetical protein